MKRRGYPHRWRISSPKNWPIITQNHLDVRHNSVAADVYLVPSPTAGHRSFKLNCLWVYGLVSQSLAFTLRLAVLKFQCCHQRAVNKSGRRRKFIFRKKIPWKAPHLAAELIELNRRSADQLWPSRPPFSRLPDHLWRCYLETMAETNKNFLKFFLILFNWISLESDEWRVSVEISHRRAHTCEDVEPWKQCRGAAAVRMRSVSSAHESVWFTFRPLGARSAPTTTKILEQHIENFLQTITTCLPLEVDHSSSRPDIFV